MAITLKAARVNKGLTQTEAAKLLGVSETTLMGWEKQKRMPRADDIQKLLKLYEVKYEDVIFFE